MPSTFPSRRAFATSAGWLFAALGFAGASRGADSAGIPAGAEVSSDHEAIHQEIVFDADFDRVYLALTDPVQFDRIIQISGVMHSGMALGDAPTAIASEAGGSFVLFGGHISGRHVELVPGVRIVQAWRAANWPSGWYSIAKFELTKADARTRLVFDHVGFPDGAGASLASGWHAHYWDPLAKFLAVSRG